MGLINPPIPTIGDFNATEDLDIVTAFTQIKDVINGNIDNANIKAAAGIAYSKLALAGSIVGADISGAAAIAYSKLNLADSVRNADVKSDAAIAFSKLAALASTQTLIGSAGGVPTARTLTGDVTVDNTGVTAIGNKKVLSKMIQPTYDEIENSAIIGNSVTTWQDVPGATLAVTPIVASVALVTANFKVAFSNPTGFTFSNVFKGALNVDGAREAMNAQTIVDFRLDSSGANPIYEVTVSRTWQIALTAAAHTLKLQAQFNDSSTSTSTVVSLEDANLSYILFGS